MISFTPPPPPPTARLTALAAAAMLGFLLLAGPAQAQMPTAEQCNDRRLFTLEKVIFTGDGKMNEDNSDFGHNGIQVNRMAGCPGLAASVLEEVGFCMNVWDTTPCSVSECKSTVAKVVGSRLRPEWVSENLTCGVMLAREVFASFIVASPHDNGVKDDPTNRLIIALADNPRAHVYFDILDDD